MNIARYKLTCLLALILSVVELAVQPQAMADPATMTPQPSAALQVEIQKSAEVGENTATQNFQGNSIVPILIKTNSDKNKEPTTGSGGSGTGSGGSTGK